MIQHRKIGKQWYQYEVKYLGKCEELGCKEHNKEKKATVKKSE